MSDETDLGWVRGVISDLNTKMDRLGDSMADVQQRLARMEGGNMTTSMDRIEARMVVLEAERNARGGAMKTGEFIWRAAPWLIAIVLAIRDYLPVAIR